MSVKDAKKIAEPVCAWGDGERHAAADRERRSQIADLCRRFGVRRLAVFGSAARGRDFDPERCSLPFFFRRANRRYATRRPTQFSNPVTRA